MMTRRTQLLLSLTSVAMMASVHGFATVGYSAGPPLLEQQRSALAASSLSMDPPYFVDVVEAEAPVVEEPKQQQSRQPKKKPANNNQHQDGIFAPAVKLAKATLGDEKLNKIRAKAISMHSDVIGNFVGTSDTTLGNMALQSLFQVADRNQNGLLEKSELETALHALGFTWLKAKQIDGIFSRADSDENGAIDLNEFVKEAPKTLRTNLIKLAKTNGGKLGFLA